VADNDAFKVLGQVEVDLASLDKSFEAAKKVITGHVAQIRTLIDKASGPVVAVGGAGAGGGAPGEDPGPMGKHAKSAGREFSHLARIVREVLSGPLVGLEPEFAKVANAMAHAARSATYLGVSLGAVVVATVLISEVIGKYIDQAKEASAATLDVNQALATLDSARAETGVRKFTEELAKYQQTVKEASGEGTFWQTAVAKFSLALDEMTGKLDHDIVKLKDYFDALIEIQKQVTVPQALIESGIRQAEILARQGEMAKKTAADLGELAAAYEKVRGATIKKEEGEVAKLENEKKKAIIGTMDASNKARDVAIKRANDLRHEADELEESSHSKIFFPGSALYTSPAERYLNQAAAKREEANKILEEAATIVGAASVAAAQQSVEFDEKIKDSKKSLTQTIAEQGLAERQENAGKAAASEEFLQKELQRNQKRLEGNSATASAIADAEDRVAKIRRDQAGTVESVASLEARLATTRANAIGPLVAGLQEANDEYASQKRAILGLISAQKDVIENQEKLRDLESKHADDTVERQNKIAQAIAETAAKEAAARRERDQAAVAREDRDLAHRIAMGGVSQGGVMSEVGEQRFDPRRTQAQQEQAEERLLQLKKEYADQYFQYYQQMGASTWEGQLQSARSFLSQTVEGSKAWFDQVAKISGLYKGIYDQAKGVFQQELGIAAAEAQRAGRTRMRLSDVDKYVDKVRRRDERILAGGSGKIGDVTAAFGREELWKTVDREGLSPSAARAAMAQSPEQRLAAAVAETATRQTAVAERQIVAAQSNAEALQENTQALRDATSALVGMGGGSDSPGKSGDRSVLASNEETSSRPNTSSRVSSKLGKSLSDEARRGATNLYTNIPS